MALHAEYASGAIFGAALVASGVFWPSIIKSQMLFQNLHMLQVFLGGSATSAIILHVADRTGFLRKTHRAPSNMGLFAYDGNVFGGALIGLGMAVTGACPGTSMTQLGVGMENGALVVFGGLIGAALFLQVRPSLQRREAAKSRATVDPEHSPSPRTTSKSLDIPSALSISPLSMLLLWIPMCIAVIGAAYVVDSSRHQNSPAAMLPPAFGGLLIGAAQTATVLLAHHQIGASTAYEDVARWVKCKLFGRQAEETTISPALITPSVAFAAGIVSSAALLKHLVLDPSVGFAEAFTTDVPFILRTIAGGASMVFGARLAGGCTSGHGISGLSKFSISSLLTTAAMFGGGMLSAQVLRAL